jgi:hypothetical protein
MQRLEPHFPPLWPILTKATEVEAFRTACDSHLLHGNPERRLRKNVLLSNSFANAKFDLYLQTHARDAMMRAWLRWAVAWCAVE